MENSSATKQKRSRYTSWILAALSVFILVLYFAAGAYVYGLKQSAQQAGAESAMWKARYMQEVKPFDKLVEQYAKESIYEAPEGFPLTDKSKSMRLPILMYHYIEPKHEEPTSLRSRLTIIPTTFEKTVSELKKDGYDFYYVKDVPDIFNGRVAKSNRQVVLTFDDGYEDFYYYVLPVLQKYNVKATLYVINNYIGRRGFLNEQQLRTIVDSGLVEIGSHTLTHAQLKGLNLDRATAEIIDSKKQLETRLGIHIATFAYPSGSFDQQAIDLVKKAGYTVAVSTISDLHQSKETIYYAPRLRAGLISPSTVDAILQTYKK